MLFHRIKLDWLVGISFALVFAFLLTLRLGFLQKSEVGISEHLAFDVQTLSDRETWMNVLQQGQKIGYAHRQFFKTAEGYRVFESVFMQINTTGMVQDIRLRTEGNFYQDMTLSSFDFELSSSLFRFKARGIFNGKILTLFAGPPGSEQKTVLHLQRETHLSVGMLEALVDENMKTGDTRTFQIFDPTTTAQRPVKVVVLSEETIPIMGRQEKAKKVSIDFAGVSQFAWIGKDGTVLREEGPLGMKLEQVTKGEALKKLTLSPGSDITEIASIPSNRIFDDANQLKELKVKLIGIEDGDLFLHGGRQSLKDKVLTIRKESVSDLPSQGSGEDVPAENKPYLESSPFIQSDHPEIRARVKEIVSPDDPDFVKANKLMKWVYQNIQKRPVLSLPNALETLRNRVGDCNEHAVLLAALARAAGIPAEVGQGSSIKEDDSIIMRGMCFISAHG